jgi:sugar phosphate permease
MRFYEKLTHLFYGWWIVFACFLIGFYVAGVVAYGFTAVFEPIVHEMGWSYAEVSLASSLRGVEAGLLAAVVGYLVERFGARLVVFIGGIISGLGLLLLSRVNSLALFYAAFILIAIGMSTCTGAAMITAVANWFQRKLGIAIGAMICGYGFSGLMVPVVVSAVDNLGWRAALALFGFGMFLIVLPLSLIIRGRPELYGYLPDGDKQENPAAISKPLTVKNSAPGMTARMALKTPAFWYIALTLAVQGLLVSAIMTHVMPYLTTVGFPRDRAGLVATFIPMASTLGRLGFGWASERMSKKYLTAFGFILMGLGLLAFGFAASEFGWLVIPFLFLFGIGYGGTNTMRAILPRAYFGQSSYGIILGFILGVGTIGDVIGAPLAGITYDRWGTYQPIWFIYAGLSLFFFFIMALTPAVKFKSEKSEKKRD